MLHSQRFSFGPTWRPLRDFARMQAEMDRLFHSANDSYAPGFPPIDVYTKDDEAILSAELPGVPANDVEISVLDDTVTIEATRAAEERPEEAVVHRQERGAGKFSRTVRLPFRIEAGAVDAHFENGVLVLTLPRAEADRPRRITIEAA